MNDHINYEDDLFFVIARLQSLRDGLKINLDTAYFKELYLQDIIYFDKMLSDFQEKLTANPLLIKLSEYLHTLGRAQSALVEVIMTITKQETLFTAAFMNDIQNLEVISQRQTNNATSIAERLREGVENYRGADIISEEELSILMATDDFTTGE